MNSVKYTDYKNKRIRKASIIFHIVTFMIFYYHKDKQRTFITIYPLILKYEIAQWMESIVIV